MGDTTVKAADHITMKIDKGEFVAIVGQSGSGKSTCMNIIGCLDVPTHGVYRLNGRDVGKMSRNELASVRNEMLGFIFQQYNLLPRLNLMENVEVPLVYAGVSRAERHARAREVLEQVGLGDKLKNRPNQLSGGQQQRVSIARALVRNPPVILADEPTGALDSHTGREVLGLLQQLHKQGHTVVLITHDNSIAVQADRIIRLEDAYQMVSAQELSDVITRALETRKPPKLSASALETLTVIAYYQPTTKAFVEQIRGVDSSYTISALLNKKLIEEQGRLSVPGRPILYGTTPDFLRTFGISSLDELPEVDLPQAQTQQLEMQLSIEDQAAQSAAAGEEATS